MADEEGPRDVPDGLILALAREIQGKSQKQLGAMIGKSGNVVSDLKKGRRALGPERLREMMQVLGLTERSVERLAAAVRDVRADAALAGLGVEPDVQQAVDAIARAWGQEQEDFLRGAMNRVLDRWAMVEERLLAPGLWKRLKRYRRELRRRVVDKDPKFHSWGLAELLCRESEIAAADDAGEAVELAELALHVANRVPGDENRRARLQGWAWYHVGNGRRVHGRMPEAGTAADTADRLWEAGEGADGGLLDAGRVLDLKASIRHAQRRFGEALDLLDQALALGPAGAAAARLLVKRAKILEEQKDYPGAAAALERAEVLFELEADPRLFLCVRFNRIEYLARLGRPAEAEALLPAVQALTAQLGNRLDGVRLRWLEGRLAAARGRAPEALAALGEVQAAFLELGILYDAALVTFDMAALLARQRRHAEARRLARRLAEAFSGQEVPVEAARALRLFWDLGDGQGQVSPEVLDQLRAEVEAVTAGWPAPGRP
jgi:tetratricopeptide (TPR) repeat protein